MLSAGQFYNEAVVAWPWGRQLAQAYIRVTSSVYMFPSNVCVRPCPGGGGPRRLAEGHALLQHASCNSATPDGPGAP